MSSLQEGITSTPFLQIAPIVLAGHRSGMLFQRCRSSSTRVNKLLLEEVLPPYEGPRRGALSRLGRPRAVDVGGLMPTSGAIK